MIINKEVIEDMKKKIPEELKDSGYHLVLKAADKRMSGKLALAGRECFSSVKGNEVTLLCSTFYETVIEGDSLFCKMPLLSFRTEGFRDIVIDHAVNMFYECSLLKMVDLSAVSEIGSARSMFDECRALEEVRFPEDKELVIQDDMSRMFYGCSSLQTIDLSSLNTTWAERMNAMFCDCSSLQKLDLSTFETANLKDIGEIAAYCTSLKELDLSFDLDHIWQVNDNYAVNGRKSHLGKDIEDQLNNPYWCCFDGMIEGADEIQMIRIRDDMKHRLLLRWMLGKFSKELRRCRFLADDKTMDVSEREHYHTITEALNNLEYAGYQELGIKGLDGYELRFEDSGIGCQSYIDQARKEEKTVWSLDGFYAVFDKDEKIIHILSHEPLHLYSGEDLFKNMKLRKITFSDRFDTSGCLYMTRMFYGCSELEELDLSGFDLSEVLDMTSMFEKCTSLRRVIMPDLARAKKKRDIETKRMFQYCDKLEESLDNLK